MGFDFEGTYTTVIEPERIEYTMSDGRNVLIRFKTIEEGTQITEIFDADNEYDTEFQRQGWQHILDRFATYVESKLQ